MTQFNEFTEEELKIAQEVSVACARDVIYLRSRSRWTQELEDQLIQLHKEGTPPNIYEFGVTNQTRLNLMDKVKEMLKAEGINIDK